jgi:hypothetical protein
MKKQVLLLATLSLFFASSALAFNFESTSGYYLQACNEVDKYHYGKPIDRGRVDVCFGFIEGAEGMHTGFTAVNKDFKFYCPVSSSNYMQDIKHSRLIWVDYLKNNPQNLHLPPIITYIAAMEKAFPCPNFSK